VSPQGYSVWLPARAAYSHSASPRSFVNQKWSWKNIEIDEMIEKELLEFLKKQEVRASE